MTFCFTGGFIYGTRADCERIVLSLGSMTVDRISGKLDYLIIGTFVEPSWVNTTYGRKIEAAVRHRDNGSEICIASEYHWAAAQRRNTSAFAIGTVVILLYKLVLRAIGK